MEVYLIRHGETAWNKMRKVQGSTDIPLNEYGIELAELTRDGLKEDGIVFDKAFASPYIRAKRTAEIILGDHKLPIQFDERIREMGFGPLEGAIIPEIKSNPEYEALRNCFGAPEKYKPVEGAESFEQLIARVKEFWKQEILPLENSCKRVVVACHGAVIRAFLLYLKGMKLEDFWSMHQLNCAVNEIHVADGNATVIRENYLYYEELPGASILPGMFATK